ncbi:melatonin receptor type 1C-like [Dysidea avara]|uniref:melatonin receptor type 1C-like n=1 Tax=Dysidea avara TaxID=196820 RepID=UPI0033218E69
MYYSGSGDDQDHNQSNVTDQEGPIIHAAFPYISLAFKLITTLIIISMASLVCVTIKKTRCLHQSRNFLIANVMIADIMLALWNTIPAGIAIVGFAAGTNVIHCGLLNFVYHPVIAYHTTFIMISVDKVIAIGFPLRYKHIMTCRVVVGMICVSWLLAVIVSFHTLFISDGSEFPEYGICILTGGQFLVIIIPYAIPIFMEAVVTTSLNLYLAIKAYQFRRRIQKRVRLSQRTAQDEDLQRKLQQFKKHLKPMLTLLIILIGNSMSSLLFTGLYIPGRIWLNNKVYYNVMEYVVRPNIILFHPLLHIVVYGVCFKQIREPMVKLMRRLCTGC